MSKKIRFSIIITIDEKIWTRVVHQQKALEQVGVVHHSKEKFYTLTVLNTVIEWKHAIGVYNTSY